ncbi:MAG: LUD domain-containing protein [Gracilibacteraceae bacterium]|jgi:iron-sulfur cluster protein|nr:LUD domain-containing protein [Gracilibacteraceae bacterium]
MANTELRKEIDRALDNGTLRGALGKFAREYPVARDKAYTGYDFEALREKVKEYKSYSRDHLDEVVDEFERRMVGRGVKVFRAPTGDAANEYVKKVAAANNVKKVIKSKSMASEEILMNEALREAGMEVQETDLGEFIIALNHEHPSHMVLPAIHLTKEQVADLFSDYTSHKNDPVIAELVKTARSVMRAKFLEADMGISGANIAVAETGTLVMISNEGNARLTSTLPRVHIYIVGLEKFIKNFREISPILKTLPRNGTGQNITTYVSMFSGPTEAYLTDEEKGEKEFHVVILDNGRRALSKNEDFKEMFQCVRCAACLNVCPAFQFLGGHVFGGHAYTGGIGTLLTAFLTSKERGRDIQNLCLQCGRCAEVCAGKLDIHGMILKLRKNFGDEGMPFVHKFILDVVSNRRLFHSMLRVASVGQLPVSRGKPTIRHLPLFLSGMTEGRSLPTVAPKPFRDIFPGITQNVASPRGVIALYTGCLLDFVYPGIAEAVVKNLNMAGYRVALPETQSCCGAPANYMGDRANAKKTAELNIRGLEAEKYDYVVSACPTCTHALREYPELLEGADKELITRAETLAAKTFDFSKLLHMLGGIPGKGSGAPLRITYHDSCHMKRTMRVFEEQREILRGQTGVELTEMKDCDQCCGFAGSYSIKYPEVSGPILEMKINNIVAATPEAVVVDCPGCMMQIRGGLDARDIGIAVKHTAEVLAERN